MSSSEVKALLDKASESLQAAELLQHEGYPGFSASRAYYAMFYAAQALLLDRGLSFSSHSAVIGAFGREYAKTAVLDPKFHRYLIDAQDFRNLGDYAIGPGVTPHQVEEILSWAREFLSAAGEILSVSD
jgi:uncharacterized protein (UPF0332 family)